MAERFEESASNMLEGTRRRMLEDIHKYEGDDPLRPWIRCLKWVKESYPAATVKLELLKLLEPCSHTFQTDRRYKSDIRYLRVWVQLVDCCADPGYIFPLLETNGIGQEHALFYEAYGTFLEIRREFAKAKDIYEVGLSREAQPMDRLKSMYQTFCDRMERRHKRKLREDRKALATRTAEAAERPLDYDHPIEAALYVGCKIYETTTDRAEASFEEERLCHWAAAQHQLQQPEFAKYYTFCDQATGNPMSRLQLGSGKLGDAVPRSHIRKSAETVDTKSLTENKQPEKDNSTEKLRGVCNFSKDYYTVKGVSTRDDNFVNRGSCVLFEDNENVPDSLPSTGIAGNTASPASPYGDVTIAVEEFANDLIVTGLNADAHSEQMAHQGLVDPTINSKIALEDILSMFNGPLDCEASNPRLVKRSKVSASASEEAEFEVFLDEDPVGQEINNKVAQNTSFQVSEHRGSFVKLNDNRERERNGMLGSKSSKSFGVCVDPELALPALATQTSSCPVGPKAGFFHDMELRTEQGGYQVFGDETWAFSQGGKAVDWREGERSKVVKSCNLPAQSNLYQQETESMSLNRKAKSYDFIVGAISPGPAEKKQSGSSTVKLDSLEIDNRAYAGYVGMSGTSISSVLASPQSSPFSHDMNTKPFADENPKFITNRPPLPFGHRMRWPGVINDDQLQSFEDENGGSRDSKRPKVLQTSRVERSGVFKSETLTIKMEGENCRRENWMQPCTSQELLKAPVEEDLIVLSSIQAPSPVTSNVLEAAAIHIDERKTGRAVQTEKVYPWDAALLTRLLDELNPPLAEYKGFIGSSKKYCGTVTLSSLKAGVRNRLLQLGQHSLFVIDQSGPEGGSKIYHLKGCTGRGAFAQVYQAEADAKGTGDGESIVVKDPFTFRLLTTGFSSLKPLRSSQVQKPACPWEFYIYRQLDIRVPPEERGLFGCTRKIHVYADCSFMVCDFGEHGTLQDVINAYLAQGQRMDEILCIYYTIEMLLVLEILHKVGLIHGDFKPDNLLLRNNSEELEEWAPDRRGGWKRQGVCLIDWGRSIDTSLFPEGTEFVGDSKTDGFRCPEMLEKKPWTSQVDTYGLCGVVHCLLHGTYMEVEKRRGADAQMIRRPKTPYKRYWNTRLWQNFFETLLNVKSCNAMDALGTLRRSFEDYLKNSVGLAKKLRQLLMKQNTLLLSRK